MRVLMWFRSDLRTDDNRALEHACRVADEGVVGVFHVADGQWREHHWGPTKAAFVLRCVTALSQKLAALNIPLLVRRVPRFTDAPADLLAVAVERRCDRLAFNREYEVNERRRDEATERAFSDAGLDVRSFHDQTILRPDSIKTGSGGFYSVFTPFKNAFLTALRGGDEHTPVASPRVQKPIDVKADAAPDRAPGFADSPIDASLWPGGEDEAMRRLDRFIVQRITGYKDRRDLPAVDGTSTLSPYLAVGAISARRCLAAASAIRGDGAATWISELIWREFYRHVLVGFPRVCMNQPFKHDTAAMRWNSDEPAFERWCAGQTGVPIVDAAMRQLRDTGWMHNRCRMIAAMFLSKNLFIDWRWGERHFARNLVDLDFASNNGGWQWSASTGTDAAPYFRIFNPTSQSERFDAAGGYIRRYVRELAAVAAPDVHDPSPLVRSACGYAEAMVDLKASRAAAIEKFRALRA